MIKQGVFFFLFFFLTACSFSKNAPIKQDAFITDKITVSTIGNPDTHVAKITIAILPFKNNTSDSSLNSVGVTLADLISTQMASDKGIKLVERQRIEDMMAELKLGQGGIVDQNSAIQIGRMLGANVMAFGSFMTLGKKVILTMRLVKVETGEVVGGVTEKSADVSDLDVLAENAAKKFLASLKRD